jgi:anti-sigma factor RsiW
MFPHRRDESVWPSPELLAAYADGELDPEARATVEAWLVAHPEAQAQVEAQRRLTQLFRDVPVPEPNPAAWQRLEARVESRLETVAAVRPRWARIPWRVAGPSAAAVLAAVLLLPWLRGPQPDPPPRVHREPQVEPFPVVSPEDVTIVALDGDGAALVVGTPPLPEALALAGPGDVTVDGVQSNVTGMNPDYPKDASGDSMLIMMPAAPAPE